MKIEMESLLRNEVVSKISPQRTVVFTENSTKAKLKSLTIENLPVETVAFTLDYGIDGLSHLIDKNHKYANERCDFVLISRSHGKLKVILGDLKSTSPDMEHAEQQLKNSQLFVDYLLSILRVFCEVDYKIEREFVIVKKIQFRRKRNKKKAFAPIKTPPFKKEGLLLGETYYLIKTPISHTKLEYFDFF